jgi:hypothetical protein
MPTPSYSPLTLCPEDELVLRCGRVSIGSEPVARVPELLHRVTDWQRVFRLASHHAMTPLVSHVLCQLDASEIPQVPVARLQAEFRGRIAWSLQLTAALSTLLDLFERNAIPAVAFKGPVLASSLYGNVALREFVDLDILVRREDVRRTKDVMVAHGYRTDLPTGPGQEAAYLRARHEVHFTPEDNSCLIEIHQAFLAPCYRFDYDMEALWQRLDRTVFYGREILTLAPDDLLLVLCAHAAKHRWCSLGWVCDVARLLAVSGQRLDWPRLERQAFSMGATRLLLLGVFLANHVLGAPAPGDILERADEDERVARLASEVTAGLLDGHGAVGDLSQHRFFLAARERVRDKLLSCMRLALVPTEEDVSLLSLPSVLSLFSYPFHAVRVMVKYGLASLNGT